MEDDLCHCWVCGYKARSLVYLLKKYSKGDLDEYIDNFFTGKKTYLNDDPEERSVHRLPTDFRLLALTTSRDPDVRAAKIYCEGRGLTKRDLWYYKLGVSSESRWARRVIVPSFDAEGQLNDFVGRAIGRFVFPKYDSPGHDKINNIFNELYVDWTRQLVLCEGPFDAMKCGENSVPLLGSELNEQSKLFERIVVNNTPVALALDADMKDTKVPILVRKLQEYDVSVVVVDVPDDPGELTKEQFSEALAKAKSYTWSNIMRDRLQRIVNA